MSVSYDGGRCGKKSIMKKTADSVAEFGKWLAHGRVREMWDPKMMVAAQNNPNQPGGEAENDRG